MSSHDVILINPPYSTMGNPYISVPVLHSYLEKENINVLSMDLDAALYKELAKPEIVRRGIDHTKKRFVELNCRENLNFAEAVEYRMFSTLLFQLSCHGKELNNFVDGDYSHDDFKKVCFNKLLITASSALSFPEMIVTVPQFAVNPLFESFSVSEIFDSLSDSNLILDIIYQNIDSIMEAHDSPVWGISVTFHDQIIKAFQCAAHIKKKNPRAFIIMGGPSIAHYFRNLPDNRLFSIVDAFAYFEGELTLKSLVGVLKNNGSLQDVPGIAFNEGNKIFHTMPPEKIHINNSAAPDYNVIDLDSFIKSRANMTVPIRLTKGCSWGKCTFCSSFESYYEQIDPEIALGQLLKVYHDTGIRNFMFSDEASPLTVLDYLSKKIIELGISISWTFHTRLTKKLTKERCRLYKQAGCSQIYIGIESTSDRILKKMGKGITFGQIKDFFDEMEPILPIGAYMMIGFPGEREDEAENGFRYLSQLVEKKKLASFVYSQFTVKTGSAIWDNPEAFGISELSKRKDLDLDHNIYCFKTEGMPLEKIYRLFSLYSGKTKIEQIFSKISRIDFQEIHETLNFSMKDTTDFVVSDTSFFYQSMRKWFSNPETIPRTGQISW
ncbi:B12-binding domain-containing radical SAM protein [Desulforegula conservatrix]|uniref:B12-binding domain-containing radical SAM protein n=1 Tax=Desulforegula conservatrix TaxID=153026 RepID=UPI000483D814|nr:radical SAM protein [Desulforegula conservatrix]